MKKNYTHVSVLLDRSYSMMTTKKPTIEGFNEFVNGQKAVPGEMTLSLSQFDDQYDVVYDFVDIQKVMNLTNETFVPRGNTALLDSLGKFINATGTRLANLKEDQRPEKVVFLILTDGGENCSKEFTNEKIKEMIEHQSNKYNWNFMYIGANQDSFTVGQSMGINNNANYTATPAGTRGLYAAATATLCSFRASSDSNAKFSVSQQDIDEASKEVLKQNLKKQTAQTTQTTIASN